MNIPRVNSGAHWYKTNRARSVPLTKRVRKIVERRLTARALNEKLFPLTVASYGQKLVTA